MYSVSLNQEKICVSLFFVLFFPLSVSRSINNFDKYHDIILPLEIIIIQSWESPITLYPTMSIIAF